MKELPSLVGSPKQVEWADGIRTKFIKNMVKPEYNELLNIESSNFWLDYRRELSVGEFSHNIQNAKIRYADQIVYVYGVPVMRKMSEFLIAIPSKLEFVKALFNKKTDEHITGMVALMYWLTENSDSYGLPITDDEFNAMFGRDAFWLPWDIDYANKMFEDNKSNIKIVVEVKRRLEPIKTVDGFLMHSHCRHYTFMDTATGYPIIHSRDICGYVEAFKSYNTVVRKLLNKGGNEHWILPKQ